MLLIFKRPVAPLILFAVVLAACGSEVPPAASANTAAAPVEAAPTTTVGGGFTYDPEASWHGLAEPAFAELVEEIREWAAARVDAGPAGAGDGVRDASAPVGAIYLGDRLRIYNTVGRWRPMTLSLLGPDDEPQWTVRLDMPPVGVVRGELPSVATGDPEGDLRLSLIEPQVPYEHRHHPPKLLDRQIGTASEPFTPDSVRQLGFGESEETTWVGGGPVAEMPAEVLQSPAAGVLLNGGTGTYRRWSAGTSGATTTMKSNAWKRMAMGDRTTEFASYGSGDPEDVPTEAWWVRGVLVQLEEVQRRDLKEAEASAQPIE